MRVLDRHILFSLAAVFVLALAGLLLLFFSVLILRYSRLVSEHHQFLSAVVATCLAGIPMHVSFFVPPASGIAAFFCLRAWQREGAWLGAVASGYDLRRWRRQFLLFALLCTATGWMFTLWLGPYAARIYFTRLDSLYADRFFLSTQPKRFVQLTKSVKLWVEAKPTQHDLRNFVLTIKEGSSQTIVAARSGRLLQSDGGLMLEAHSGSVLRNEGTLSQHIHFQRLRYGLESLVNPQQGWQNRLKEWTRLEIPTTQLLRRMARAKQASARAVLTQEKGESARRELVLRFAYPLLAAVYAMTIFAFCAPTSPRGESRWSGLTVFIFLLVYSTAHIYAVTLSERGVWSTGAVFVLSATTLIGAYALTEHKANLFKRIRRA